MTHVPTYPERNKRNKATFIGPLEIFDIQLLVKYVVLGSKLLSQENHDPLEKTETSSRYDNSSPDCICLNVWPLERKFVIFCLILPKCEISNEPHIYFFLGFEVFFKDLCI